MKSHPAWRILLAFGGIEAAEAIDADVGCVVRKEFAGRVAASFRRVLVVLLIALGEYLSGTAAAQTNLTFPDPNLEAAIRSALNRPTGPLSSLDLQSLSSLSASRQNIGNLSGLEWATNLTELSLSENFILDITPLKGLKRLIQLSLARNFITDLSPLARSTNLSSLDLSWNYLGNCAPLSSCTNLSTVYLRGNVISDLSFVQNLKRLSFLNLDYNKIRNLSPLSAVTNLEYLSLSANSITNYKALTNLSGLINLELRANSLSNLDFISSLHRLRYADLAYNNLTNLASLSGLTNLSNLILTGNQGLDYAELGGLRNLSGLWLCDNLISNLDLVQGVRQLSYLDLDGNRIAELASLSGLTNLTGLGLGHNPLSNHAALNGLTNLNSLSLDESPSTDLGFLKGLSQLSFLSLRDNRLDALGVVDGLTNLVSIDVEHNVLTNISTLTNLPSLKLTGLAGNLLSLSPGSEALDAIESLQNRGVDVRYVPQNQPPGIWLFTNWTIAANATSTREFWVYDDLTRSNNLIVSGTSSDTTLISNSNITLRGTNSNRILSLTPGTNQTGRTTITLTVTDDAGLSAEAIIDVTVQMATNVSIPDPSLEAAIRLALGKAEGALSSVDLLGLSELFIIDPRVTNLTGLEWATNLRTLFLSGNSISSLTPLQNLTELSSLSLYNTSVRDLSALEGLTNLISLSLQGNAITNYGAGLSQLSSLYLTDDSLSDLSFLEDLRELEVLVLANNRISDISPLAGLTNLNALSLQQNLITNIVPIQNLPQLSDVDVTLNLLDLSPASTTMTVLETLQSRAVRVQYLPQREPPVIEVRSNWFVAANSTALLTFQVLDNGAPSEQLVVTASSPDPSLEVMVSTNSDRLNWILRLTPAPNHTGTATVSLRATDDAGLSAEALIEVRVMIATNVGIPDPSLEAAIRLAAGKFVGDLTSVDLLALAELHIDDATITNLVGLEWAANLRTLFLSGPVSSLVPLQNLNKLSSLDLYNTSVADLSPLTGLANLTSLSIYGNGPVNYDAVLPGLTNLSSLSLRGNSISNLSFLENLTQLTSLSLDTNRIIDISALAGLTNLNALSLRQNRITNIAPLQDLQQLTAVDLTLNLLDPSPASATRAVVELLQSQGCVVQFLPQREPPVIEMRTHWFIATNATALLPFAVMDNGATREQLVLSASSSDPSLIPNVTVIGSQDAEPDSLILRVTPADDRIGTATIFLSATNEVGLGTTTTILLTVVVPQPIENGLFTNLTWTTYGEGGWFGQNFVTPDGLLALQSGAIADGEESTLQTTVTGPAMVSFWWKVSSDKFYDWLEFYVNGVQSLRISGEVDWQQQIIALPSGVQTLGWRYSKDPNPDTAQGLDAGWLAQIKVNVSPVLAVPADQSIEELSQLVVTNTVTDVDSPANALRFELVSGPEGVFLNPLSGVLSWTPTESQGPSTNWIIVRVTDDGSPPTSTTNSFRVVVKEVNTQPTLTLPADLTIEEQTRLAFVVTVSDPDLPANVVIFNLLSAPAGMTLDSDTGALAWTPTETQGPSTNLITIKVADNGVPPLSATNSFTIVVTEVNRAPVLTVPPDQTINELSTLVLTNTATDPDIPANPLTFHLLSAPAGMTLDSNTGVLIWTPTETQGPSTNLVTVKVTDNGAPALSATNSFTVRVTEVNRAPVLTVPPDQTINELGTLVLTNTATDPDIPANPLTFHLLSAPTGMTLDSNTGVLIWTPTETQGPSTNLVTVKVTDNGAPALSATNSFTIRVTEVNRAPVLTLPPDQAINELSTLVLTNTAADPDIPANTLTFHLLSAPAGMTLDSNTGVLIWTPTETQGPSTNLVTLKVTDNGVPALSATNSFTIRVTEVNRAPVLTVPPDQIINELSTLVLTNTAADPDIPANTLTFKLVSAPAGTIIDSKTGVLVWTPSEVQGPSTNLITVQVTDNGTPALSATNSFTVTVNEVNSAPVFPVQAARTINELALLTVTNTASDADWPANGLTYQLVNPPTGASIAANGVISWTPSEAQGPSTNTFTTIVMDDGTPPLSATNSFTVFVNEVNRAPGLTVPANQIISELTLLVVTNIATDPDIPANSLTFSLLAAPDEMTIDSNTGVLTWTPNEAQGPSTNLIMVKVTDNGVPALSHTESFTVVVNEVNRAPVLTPLPYNVIHGLATLVVTNIATDPDLPANTLTFSLVSAPDGVSLDSSSGVVTWTPTEAQFFSTNLIVVRVTDNGSPPLSDTISFTVIVLNNELNNAPVLTPVADQWIDELSPLVLTNSATDPDIPANTLTFSLLSAPPGMIIDSNTGVLTWTPSESQGPSTNLITVKVTDNETPPLSATNSFTVTVTEVNSAPLLPAQSNRTINELTTLTVTNTATDGDLPANVLSYQLVSPPAGASISASGVIRWTPGEDQGPGTATFTTIVTDNGTPALSATNSFTVTVNEVNSHPLLSPIGDQLALAGFEYTFTNSASDPDLPSNILTFSLDDDAPEGAAINPNNGVFSWTPPRVQAPTTNIFTVRVTDNGEPTLSDVQRVKIVVISAPVIESIVAVEDLVAITWSAEPGKTYRLQFKSDLRESSWEDISGDVVAEGWSATKTDLILPGIDGYYRVIVLP